VGLERGPLSLLSTTEELLDRKVATPVHKTENTAVGICYTDHVAPSIRRKLAITSLTSGGRSVSLVRSRTQTMEFVRSFVSLFPKATTGLVLIGYKGALLSTLLHDTVYVTHNFLDVLVQIANKMGLEKRARFLLVLRFPLQNFHFTNCSVLICHPRLIE
jgi:hypothetical protein